MPFSLLRELPRTLRRGLLLLSRRWLGLLLVCFLSAGLASAAGAGPAPDTAVIRRLPAGGLALTTGWRAHPGDNPAWARPDFDDRGWESLDPTRPRREQPAPYRTGISWWRKRLRLGDSLRRRDLLADFSEIGAIEVYLDGRLVGRQGTVAADPAQVGPRGKFPYPAEIPAGGHPGRCWPCAMPPGSPRGR